MQRWATSRKIHLRCSEMQDLESGPRIGWQDPTSGELEAASHSSMQARMLGKETLQETEHRSIGQEREGQWEDGVGCCSSWQQPNATVCALQDPQTFPNST